MSSSVLNRMSGPLTALRSMLRAGPLAVTYSSTWASPSLSRSSSSGPAQPRSPGSSGQPGQRTATSTAPPSKKQEFLPSRLLPTVPFQLEMPSAVRGAKRLKPLSSLGLFEPSAAPKAPPRELRTAASAKRSAGSSFVESVSNSQAIEESFLKSTDWFQRICTISTAWSEPLTFCMIGVIRCSNHARRPLVPPMTS